MSIAETLPSKNELIELLEYLTPQERDELDWLLTTEEPVWRPFPGPQQRAYECAADVIGYGGAAGGGKTDLALGKAFTQFYKTIVYRREYPQFKDFIPRGDEIQDGRCKFVYGEKRYWQTSDGRRVEIGSVQYESDVQDYKGRPHDFVVIDEAADFTEYMFRFLTGWLRTDRPEIKPQVLLTFNPPSTPEGEWIIQYFAPWLDDGHANPAEPGEIRWFIRAKDDKDIEVSGPDPVEIDGETYTPQSRTFFRALVEDNPVYMATGYDKQLESLPEPLRSQLRWGDFTVSTDDDIWQVIPTAWILAAENRYLKGQRPAIKPRAVGVDPARGGGDLFAIAMLYETWFETIEHEGRAADDGAKGAKLVTDALGNDNPPVAVDVIGIGSSVYDHLKAMPGMNITPVNVGSGSSARDKTGRYAFFNLRSQIVWQFREALDPASGENIALPPNRKLRADLRSPHYSTTGGKIKVESKDDIKKRLGRSTDDGDAVLLAWYLAHAGGIRLPIILDW